jgi:hypothetical protein
VRRLTATFAMRICGVTAYRPVNLTYPQAMRMPPP